MEHHRERWQYMGTRLRDNGWEHTFRHRYHPEINARTNREVPAAAGWEPTHL